MFWSISFRFSVVWGGSLLRRVSEVKLQYEVLVLHTTELNILWVWEKRGFFSFLSHLGVWGLDLTYAILPSLLIPSFLIVLLQVWKLYHKKQKNPFIFQKLWYFTQLMDVGHRYSANFIHKSLWRNTFLPHICTIHRYLSLNYFN